MIIKRVPAYTIMELSIGMLVAGILIGIVFTVFNIFISINRAYTKKNEDLAVLLVLENVLKKDVLKADLVEKTDSGFRCMTKRDSVYYQINPRSVVRKQKLQDTFNVNITNIHYYFNAKEVEYFVPPEELLTDILFDVNLNGNKIPYRFIKRYSSEDLNQKSDADDRFK